MADIERSIYFYAVEMLDGGEWRRADVLRGLEALTGDNQLLDLGSDNYAWAKVDHIPQTSEGGRLRFFRDRRANLPGWAHQGTIAELPIPADAGIIEPTHLVLAGDGLIAAEYNHFAPRITSSFAALLRLRLGMSLNIGTYVQGSIIEQLDRLDYIQLLEVSLVPSPELEEALRNSGPIGNAAVSTSASAPTSALRAGQRKCVRSPNACSDSHPKTKRKSCASPVSTPCPGLSKPWICSSRSWCGAWT